jgi:hypothetical protein
MPQPYLTPPCRRRADGGQRCVGLEVELGGLDVEATAKVEIQRRIFSGLVRSAKVEPLGIVEPTGVTADGSAPAASASSRTCSITPPRTTRTNDA